MPLWRNKKVYTGFIAAKWLFVFLKKKCITLLIACSLHVTCSLDRRVHQSHGVALKLSVQRQKKFAQQSQSCVDTNWTHRSVAFVTKSHRALCSVITVRIICNTHAVSKGSCGKLARGGLPSWRNCKVGCCYFYKGFTFYFKKKRLWSFFFSFSLNIMDMWWSGGLSYVFWLRSFCAAWFSFSYTPSSGLLL